MSSSHWTASYLGDERHLRRLYRLHCEFNLAAVMDKEIATGFLIRAWEAVTTAALDDAWAPLKIDMNKRLDFISQLTLVHNSNFINSLKDLQIYKIRKSASGILQRGEKLPIDQVLIPEHFDSCLLRERLMLILHCKDITQRIFFRKRVR
jgi:hypothetical protein